MKQLLFILSLLPSLLFAAVGDITSIVIRPDGFSAEITIEGFTSGSTYDFDLDTDNVPTSTTPYLTVVREAFDDSGAATTVTDTVYLTAIMRVPYATKTQAGGTWSGTFVDGETITCSTSGATAIIVGNQSSGAVLRYKSLTGTPLSGQTWSGAAATFVNSTNTVTTLTAPTNDEIVTSTGLVARVSLSEFVYVGDNTGAGKSGTAPTVTLKSGFIVNSGGSSQNSAAVTAGAVTNNSTATYQPVLGNWSYPAHGSLMDANSKLRVVAFDRHARQGRPVRAVKFTVTDGTTTINNIVEMPSYDPSMLDPVPVVEYVSDTDLTAGMTQGANLTLNFTIYPWVGDTPLVSSDGGFSYPTPLHCTLTAVCDKTGAYGKSFAVVDAATGADPAVGSDSGKWVGDGAAHGTGAGLTPYLTIARAVRAVRDRNNATSGRDDVSGSVVYVKAGSYNWLGATIAGTYGATPNAFVTIKPYTGVARADCIISGTSGNTDLSDRVKLENITFTATANNIMSGCLGIWFDGCDFNTTGTAIWNSSGQTLWVTHCKVTALSQGFMCFSTSNVTWGLVRGCDMDTFAHGMIPYMVIGNRSDGDTTMSATLLQGAVSGMTGPDPQSQIVAYNRFYGIKSATGTMATFGANADLTQRGMAFVGNIWETTGASGAQLADIGSSEGVTTNTPVNNVILWHNTFIGQRQNFAYNSSGTTVKERKFWSMKNNLFYSWNTKHDVFGTNGLLVGGWSVNYGVGSAGNLFGATSGGFSGDFVGIRTHYEANWVPTGPGIYFGFVDYQASVETVADTGDGDYRLKTSSPAYRRQADWVLPYDVNGKPRSGTTDSAGAFSEGGVRPASMMFAN